MEGKNKGEQLIGTEKRSGDMTCLVEILKNMEHEWMKEKAKVLIALEEQSKN